MWVAHCGLTCTRWRHDGQCGGGNNVGSTPRPNTQPLDGNTTGSAAAVATWAAHHGPTCRGQHSGGGDVGSTLQPDTHSMATRWAVRWRWQHRQHTMAQHAGCYDHGSEDLFFLLTIVTHLLTADYPTYPALPTLPRPLVRSIDCASVVPFQDHRFIRLTYLMPRFDSYCMYHSSLESLPIRLVVDRP